jgi:hypothetical protein
MMTYPELQVITDKSVECCYFLNVLTLRILIILRKATVSPGKTNTRTYLVLLYDYTKRKTSSCSSNFWLIYPQTPFKSCALLGQCGFNIL